MVCSIVNKCQQAGLLESDAQTMRTQMTDRVKEGRLIVSSQTESLRLSFSQHFVTWAATKQDILSAARSREVEEHGADSV
jgi:hypothetical protein